MLKNSILLKTLCKISASFLAVSTLSGMVRLDSQAKDDVIRLRVCNWEEYIDLGDWDEDETIELDNGVTLFGENAIYEEFEDWFYETYGKKVEVEYSCFGTNEDLYNQLTLGDTYDLVCPSDYMLMKLMAEGKAEPFSDEFFNQDNPYNYYVKGVSPYIANVFANEEINGEYWDKYAACYMWGITGILYNPEYVEQQEAETWGLFDNPKFFRQSTLKDNVRDTYFAALGYLKGDLFTSEAYLNDPDYRDHLQTDMNDVSPETIAQVEELLQREMGNIYALETDSGKADMITGKIKANYQWSGDAVYAMDQAEEDGVELYFAVPKECTNLWFDGWIMLKDGIGQDADRKLAAEAFINYLSRPDNAVRNMYYIGYTSSIVGEEGDDTVFSYLNYCYASEEEEEGVPYSVAYFFSEDADSEDYIVYADEEQTQRQLYAQYPPLEVIQRSAYMKYFDEEATRNINQMWINIRCFNLKDIPGWAYVIFGVAVLVIMVLCIVNSKKKIPYDKEGQYGIMKRKGFHKKEKVISKSVNAEGKNRERIIFSFFLLVLLGICAGFAIHANNLWQEKKVDQEKMNLLETQLKEKTLQEEQTSLKLMEMSDLYERILEDFEKEEAEEPQEENVTKHKVYLTFDDGPSSSTMEILDILDQYQVKATFFVLGKEDEASKEALTEIVNRGHSVGMHSYSHEYGQLYESMDAFVEDYHKISDYIYENTGLRSTLYRFPGGSSNKVSNISLMDAAKYLTGCGVVYYDWNVSSGDAEKKKLTVEKLIENSTDQITKRGTNIILLHDAASKDVTVEALPQLIETILAMEDTEILPITEETKPIQHIHVN